jgi:hypothetical protein
MNSSHRTSTPAASLSGHPIATPDQIALELQAVELLKHPIVQQAREQIGQEWIGKMRPSAELRAIFEREYEQIALCCAINVFNADTYHPKIHAFCRFPHRQQGIAIPGTKAGHPNPDYVYRFIPVDDRSHYLISGKVPENEPAAFELGLIDQDQVYLGTVSGHQLAIGPDGTFSISVDPEPAQGRVNHIQSKPGACQIIVRDVLADVASDRPYSLAVERLARGAAPAPLDDDPALRYAAAVRKFIDELDAATAMLTKGRDYNEFLSPALYQDGVYLATQAYSPGRYRIADDEALVATLTLGNANYAVVPVSNYWGGINGFLNHVGCLGTGRAAPNPDGSYSFVVSMSDPGIHNWIDPDGQHEGILCIRWVGFDPARRNQPHPTLSTRLVKLNDLPGALPAGCPSITAAMRAAQLERHRADYLGIMGDA